MSGVSEPKNTCLEISLVSLLTTNNNYGWSLGPCNFELNNVGDRMYTEVCCLSGEKSILTCRAADKNGWKNAFLMINGHRFCDDFVGYKAMIDLDTQGIFKMYTKLPTLIVAYNFL